VYHIAPAFGVLSSLSKAAASREKQNLQKHSSFIDKLPVGRKIYLGLDCGYCILGDYDSCEGSGINMLDRALCSPSIKLKKQNQHP
jgi:hypothetical protein